MAARRNARNQNDRVIRQVGRELAREEAVRERGEQQTAKERHLQVRRDEAAALTAKADQARDALDGLLREALTRPVRALDLVTLRVVPADPPLHLGADAESIPPPGWASVPAEPGAVGRMLGGQARHERAVAEARARLESATAAHAEAEGARQQRVIAAQRRHAERVDAARRQAKEQNAAVDRLIEGVPARDRHAVSDYYQLVIDSVRDPAGFPSARRAAYVPESELLAVEWDLPRFAIVPEDGTYRYLKARDEIDHVRPVPLAQRRALYQRVIAQIALRALRFAFEADPGDLVTTVAFIGMMDDIDPATGQEVRRCLITLRATREQFSRVVLEHVDPVKCVRDHFSAEVSEHPDELAAVMPVLNFDLTDPRVIDAVDVLSEIDVRPNLLDYKGRKFEQFVHNLFEAMGLQVQLFKPGGDDGVDCTVYNPDPIFGGKFSVQAKCWEPRRTVPPTYVRDLYGTMMNEGASKGILITTSGFGPASYAFANGKPLTLLTGEELLGLCRKYGIPARILPTDRRGTP